MNHTINLNHSVDSKWNPLISCARNDAFDFFNSINCLATNTVRREAAANTWPWWQNKLILFPPLFFNQVIYYSNSVFSEYTLSSLTILFKQMLIYCSSTYLKRDKKIKRQKNVQTEHISIVNHPAFQLTIPSDCHGGSCVSCLNLNNDHWTLRRNNVLKLFINWTKSLVSSLKSLSALLNYNQLQGMQLLLHSQSTHAHLRKKMKVWSL